MKKRLEAELISIAHRVLKLKNKSEVDQLYHETQKLYEALAILKFYGDNYEQVKSEIPSDDLDEKLATSLEEKAPKVEAVKAEPIVEVALVETPEEEILAEAEEIEEVVAEEQTPEVEVATEEEPVVVGEITLEEDEEESEEVPVGEAKSDLDFEPIFEMAPDADENELEEQTPMEDEKSTTQQISFEDLLGENYVEPVFVKPNDVTKPNSKKEITEDKIEVAVEKAESKSLSLNDKLSKSINIGLNDRIGFVKHLFGESTEDYNRVLSQLNTFSSFEESKDFIEEIIKPDYNNWEGKEDYAARFMNLVEKKFA